MIELQKKWEVDVISHSVEQTDNKHNFPSEIKNKINEMIPFNYQLNISLKNNAK